MSSNFSFALTLFNSSYTAIEESQKLIPQKAVHTVKSTSAGSKESIEHGYLLEIPNNDKTKLWVVHQVLPNNNTHIRIDQLNGDSEIVTRVFYADASSECGPSTLPHYALTEHSLVSVQSLLAHIVKSVISSEQDESPTYKITEQSQEALLIVAFFNSKI